MVYIKTWKWLISNIKSSIYASLYTKSKANHPHLGIIIPYLISHQTSSFDSFCTNINTTMPGQSTQKKLENTTNLIKIISIIESDSDSELEDDTLILINMLKKRYRVPRINHLHNPQYKRQKLCGLPELSFQQLFRTSLNSFFKLVDMIENDPIFKNNSKNPQRDPAVTRLTSLIQASGKPLPKGYETG